MRRTLLWKPDDFTPDRPPRKVSWLELFHDLVYVVAISQLAHGLLDPKGAHGYALFALLFGLVLWSWMNGTYYFDLHGNQGLWTRAFTWLQMLLAALLAITVPEVFHGDTRPFAIAFCGMQALITLLWWSTGVFDPYHRSLSLPHSGTYAVAWLCCIAAVFTGPTLTLVLWATALALNFGVELLIFRRFEAVMKAFNAEFKPSASIVERFGLFTIIVLGESILGILTGMGDAAHWSLVRWASFILSMLIAFLLWWLYFEVLGDRVIRTGFRSYVLLNLLHLPLFAAFAMLGPGMRLALGEGANETGHVRWMIAASIAIVLMMVVALASIMTDDHLNREQRSRENRRMSIGAVGVLLVTATTMGMGTFAFMVGQGLLLLVLVVQGTLSGAYPKLLGGMDAIK